jgi:hypothetical protein
MKTYMSFCEFLQKDELRHRTLSKRKSVEKIVNKIKYVFTLNALFYYILKFSKYLNKNYVYGDSFQNLRMLGQILHWKPLFVSPGRFTVFIK